ncbi:MAG: efflux RND transporter periplasmic adaptor subunit [Acidobacteriaceae bacterium]
MLHRSSRLVPTHAAALLAFVATLCLGFAAGCAGDTAPPPEPVVAVETATVKTAAITQVIHAEGVLFPIHQASLSPKITAPVRTFYVNRGDRVHRGQLLAVLDNRDLAAAVISAEGSYDQAKATYASTTSSTLPEEIQKAELDVRDARAALDAQQKVYDSERKLYEQGALARKQLDQTEVALTAARSASQTAEKRLQNLQASGASQQRQAAKGQLESSHGQYLAATAQLQYTQMRSPIDGAIADRAVYPGDIAPAGTPLLVVMDTTRVVVRLHIPQAEAVQLKLGDKAELQVPGLTNTFPCTVTVLSPALDPSSTTVEVWVEADNPQNQLKPGATVEVSINARRIPDAIVIPASAVLTGDAGKPSVMLVKSDGRAYSQEIATGIREGQSVQVLSGLKPGETVIATGAYGLPDKTKVKATPANSSTDAQPSGS